MDDAVAGGYIGPDNVGVVKLDIGAGDGDGERLALERGDLLAVGQVLGVDGARGDVVRQHGLEAAAGETGATA